MLITNLYHKLLHIRHLISLHFSCVPDKAPPEVEMSHNCHHLRAVSRYVAVSMTT